MKVHKNSETFFFDNYQKFTNKILNYWFQNLPPVVKVCKQKYIFSNYTEVQQPKVNVKAKGKNIPE
jgi:hypothetical protein